MISTILLLGTILSTVPGRIEDVAGSVRRNVLLPIGQTLDRLLAPVDRALQPVADGYNRRLGTYFGEMTGLQFALIFGALIALLTAGLWAPLVSGSLLRTLALASIWAIFAMSWDIQSGYTGYISFGHSVLSAAAGYTTALLLVHVNPELSLWITAPISVLAALVLGLLIALPSLRLEGPYFSLITFVAVLLFYRLTTAFTSLGGIPGFSSPDVFTWDPTMRYYYMLVPMLLIALALTFMARSNLGMILVAIRENESAVSAAGINPTKFKIWSFALSSIPMGIGGVLLVGFTGNVDPHTFVIVDNSIEMIAMAVIGGMSSILGPLGGAFLFEFLNHEVLHGFSTPVRYLFLWGLVLLVLVFARDGLFRMIWHRLGAVRGENE
ncbi:branched-chain amino acid ABC transporter permease [Natronorubrum sp. JWXQ-INN-674]|uniref:Branched-chain amino acid ABC transporter permease n=1 Tax=Natronorubrum halalkaliphilum TaxID=2691917 RepID=A0A6B0VJ24_9EURY|nr:branched-chain amino acid ABC transporter permease [Natronorubrum halalkaliphilum]MXV61075.1 branched-chain amino acid ABC transporter permease [Natronorubrum halalkaliphilum]